MTNCDIWKNTDYITAIMKQSGLTDTLKQICTYTLSTNVDYMGGTVSGFFAFDLIPLNQEDSKLYLYVKYEPGKESFLKEIRTEYVKNNKCHPSNDDVVILYAIFLAFKAFKKYIDEKYINEAIKQAPTFGKTIDKLDWGDIWIQSLTENDGTIINYCGSNNFLAIIGY